jgi:hypothetical protein
MMNKRIKELAEQAHSYACKYAQQPDYNPHNPYNQGMYKQRYDSKFAELIVGEFYETIKKDMELAHIQLIPIDFGIYANGRLRRIIKEHFGVEEW